MSLDEAITVGHRVDWWRVLMDLRRSGLSMKSIEWKTSIPKSTLAGYMNLYAEPRHADGVRLIALWRSVMCPPLPIQDPKSRSRRAENGSKSLSAKRAVQV